MPTDPDDPVFLDLVSRFQERTLAETAAILDGLDHQDLVTSCLALLCLWDTLVDATGATLGDGILARAMIEERAVKEGLT